MELTYYISNIEYINSNEYREAVVHAVNRLLSLYDDNNMFNLRKLDYKIIPPHIIFNCALTIYFRLKEKPWNDLFEDLWKELLADAENVGGYSVKDKRVIATIWGLVYEIFQNQRNLNIDLLDNIEKKVHVLGQPYLYFETVVGFFKLKGLEWTLSEDKQQEMDIDWWKEDCWDKDSHGNYVKRPDTPSFKDWQTKKEEERHAEIMKKSFDDISAYTKEILALNRLEESLSSSIVIGKTKMSAVKSFIEECLIFESLWGMKKPWCSWFSYIDYNTVEVKKNTPRNSLITISDKNKRTIIIIPEESGIDAIVDVLDLLEEKPSEFLVVIIKSGKSEKVKYVPPKELEKWHNNHFPGKTLFFPLHHWAVSCPVYKKISETRLNEWARCTFNLIESNFVTPLIDKNGEWKLRWNFKLQNLVYWCYKVLNECGVWVDGSLKVNFDLFDNMFVSKGVVYSSDDLKKEFDRITEKDKRNSEEEDIWIINTNSWKTKKEEIDKLFSK